MFWISWRSKKYIITVNAEASTLLAPLMPVSVTFTPNARAALTSCWCNQFSHCSDHPMCTMVRRTLASFKRWILAFSHAMFGLAMPRKVWIIKINTMHENKKKIIVPTICSSLPMLTARIPTVNAIKVKTENQHE